MKKTVSIIMLSMLLLLTGCTKQMTCTSKGNADDITIIQEYKIKYEKNVIKNISAEKIYKFENKEKFESFENLMDYTASQQQENIEIEYKKKNKKYILKQKFDMEKLSDEQVEKYGLTKDKDTFVNSLKESGLQCK